MTAAAGWFRRAAGAAFVAVCALALWSASGAAAATPTGRIEVDLPAHDTGFTSDPIGSLLDVTRMMPGSSANGIMGVRNGSGGAADLTISTDNVTSDENGCMHPELAVPGGCSPGPGQLGGELVFGLSVANSEGGSYVTTWTGSAAELKSGVHLTSTVPGGGTVWVRMSVALPWAAGNEVQSDRYGFDLRVTLEGAGGAASLGFGGLATSAAGGGGSDGAAGGLAFTGVSIALLILAAALAGFAGAVLLSAGRQRRSAAPAA